jgi:hypothetical protein
MASPCSGEKAISTGMLIDGGAIDPRSIEGVRQDALVCQCEGEGGGWCRVGGTGLGK